ncbi:MAG: hypothetical protein M5U14_07115 [Acidimicrobiia bacterium]|nr:hypothetical protein [Acidimicrobiia bacterium]
MTPGDEWEQSCSATTEGSEGVGVSAGPYRFVGEEVVDVDGEGVPAHRFRQERVMSGSQSGTQTADLWFAVGDGLPLRNERRIEVRSDTILGTVTYEEEGGFRLAELGPVASTTVPPAPPG